MSICLHETRFRVCFWRTLGRLRPRCLRLLMKRPLLPRAWPKFIGQQHTMMLKLLWRYWFVCTHHYNCRCVLVICSLLSRSGTVHRPAWQVPWRHDDDESFSQLAWLLVSSAELLLDAVCKSVTGSPLFLYPYLCSCIPSLFLSLSTLFLYPPPSSLHYCPPSSSLFLDHILLSTIFHP